jgi:MYXO-CTERM domain-containing protein
MRKSTASIALAAALTFGTAPAAMAAPKTTPPVTTPASTSTATSTESDNDSDKTGLWGLLGLLGLAGLAGLKRRNDPYDNRATTATGQNVR